MIELLGRRVRTWFRTSDGRPRWPAAPRRMTRIRQRDATDCGAACLCAVAAFHGAPVPVARVRQLAGTDAEGTTVLGLIEAAERLGFMARGVRAPVDRLARVPLPAIAHLIADDGAGHYVVVNDVTARHTTVMDPSDGRVHRWPIAEFARRWTGVLVLLAPGERFAPTRAGASPAGRLFALVRPHRTILARALALAVLYTILGLSTSVYVQKVVDHVVAGGRRDLLDLMSIAVVALVLVQGASGAMRGVLTLRVAQRIDAELIVGYYSHLLRLPQRFFDTMRVGEVTSRVGDAVKIRAFISDVVLDAVVSALVVAFSLGLMAVYAPSLAVVAAAAVPVYWAIHRVTSTSNRRNERMLTERGAELEAHLVESVTGVATIKQFGVERFAELRMQARLGPLLRSAWAAAVTSLGSGASAEAASRLCAVALLWVGAGQVADRRLTPGALMSCYALLGYLTGPIGRLIGMNRAAHDALIAADRLFEIMDLDRESGEPRLDLTATMVGALSFERLSMRYGGRTRALDDVTFTAPRGTLTAIVGESGSGKSTILAAVQRLYPPEAGRVCIGEHDVAQLSLESLRRLIAVVPQRVELFTGTLLENVALGETDPDVARVVDVCRRLGLTELIRSLPNGLDSQIGEHGATLSGGQRQRIAIARALYRAPEILLLDEATAALDSVAEQHVQRAMHELTRAGKTVVLVAHRLSTVVHADNIVVLDTGRVVEQGAHTDLLRRGGPYARLWAHQYPASRHDAAAA